MVKAKGLEKCFLWSDIFISFFEGENDDWHESIVNMNSVNPVGLMKKWSKLYFLYLLSWGTFWVTLYFLPYSAFRLFPWLLAADTLWCCAAAISKTTEISWGKVLQGHLGQDTRFQIQAFLRVKVLASRILFCLIAEKGANHKVWFQIILRRQEGKGSNLVKGSPLSSFSLFFLFLFLLFIFFN